jgi:hypothetical protein
MENQKIVLAVLGGAIAFYLYRDSKKKKIAVSVNQTSVPTNSPSQTFNPSGTESPQTKEQPVISTNNAQQAPTKLETSNGVI